MDASTRASTSSPDSTSQSPSDVAFLANVEALQAQIDQLSEQLAESQRLATVGTIASVIAHEFNNLLTPIVSYCQLALQQIEKRKDDPELTKKALTKSLQHAARAGKISTAMLNLVRNQGEARSVAVQSLIEETLAVLARDPSKDGIALRVQVPPELTVRGDAVQLEQVLLNLLINARQALMAQGHPRGGSISIRAERSEDQTIRISVSDSGPGIPSQNLPRIFEPFFTTKTNPRPGESRGSGLGLHLCKQIVERHGGSIQVKSQVGEGTTFSLLLPAA